jgi:hypothetical protein
LDLYERTLYGKKAVVEKTFVPDLKAGEVYKKYKNLYKEFLVTMRENFLKLVDTPGES